DFFASALASTSGVELVAGAATRLAEPAEPPAEPDASAADPEPDATADDPVADDPLAIADEPLPIIEAAGDAFAACDAGLSSPLRHRRLESHRVRRRDRGECGHRLAHAGPVRGIFVETALHEVVELERQPARDRARQRRLLAQVFRASLADRLGDERRPATRHL